MKIIEFKFYDSIWDFSPIVFCDHLNLFVGESGSGKTRLLNVLFNVANFASRNERFCEGNWKMSFSHKGISYQWEYSGIIADKNTNKIVHETLSVLGAGGEKLISRSENGLMFNGIPVVPKLSSSTSAIHLFKEEASVVNAHEALSSAFTTLMNGISVGSSSLPSTSNMLKLCS